MKGMILVARRGMLVGFLATVVGCRRRSPDDASPTASADAPPSPSASSQQLGERVVPSGVETSSEAEVTRIAPIVSRVLAEVGRSVRAGLRTKDLEVRAVELLRNADLDPRMLGFRGFPSAIAVSIDDEVVHGIPSERRMEEGQLVKIQMGGRTRRGSADQGWTFAVGSVSEEKKRLQAGGRRALGDALALLRAGVRTGDLGATIQATLEGAGLSAVRDFVGYGIGEKPMQDPQLPCFGVRGRGTRLIDGMILHVHVIADAGGYELIGKEDQWTMVTKDGRPSALFTAVVRVGADGCDVLTPLLA
jgi:methionyl aminopeptidase